MREEDFRKGLVKVLTLSLCFWAGAALASDLDMQLRLSTSHPAVQYGERVNVRIDLENAGTGYWVFYPRFFPVPVSGGLPVPRNILTFSIVDARGRPARLVEGDGIVDEKMGAAGLCDFFLMGPANTFGFALSLSAGQWKHGFLGPGHYAIQARLVTDARAWLQRRVSSGRVALKDIPFDLDHVLEGTLESNTIEVDLR